MTLNDGFIQIVIGVVVELVAYFQLYVNNGFIHIVTNMRLLNKHFR